MTYSLLVIAASTLVFSLAGCGRGDQPDLGLVTGTVTMDDAPLKGVQVMFSPENGRPAIGMTDAEGKYTLKYIRDSMGCKVGPNKVEIGLAEGDDVDATSDASEDAAPKKPRKSSKPRIPARYNSNTELTADVKPGENVFDFKLESGAAK